MQPRPWHRPDSGRKLGWQAAPEHAAEAFLKRADGAPGGGQRDRIHRAGAGAAEPLQPDPWMGEQGIEYAPGEGAVGAAALKSQVECFHAPTVRNNRAPCVSRTPCRSAAVSSCDAPGGAEGLCPLEHWPGLPKRGIFRGSPEGCPSG